MEKILEVITKFFFKSADAEQPEEHSEITDPNSHGLELVNESRRWYHDQYKRSVSLCFGLVIALLCSLILNGILFFSTPPPQYFALTEDLRVIELTPTDRAIMSQEKLLNWVSATVTKTFTFDFLNYRDVLMSVRPNYNKGCFESLTKSMKSSGNLEMVITKRLVTRATLSGTPVILKEGIIKGHHMWSIEIPLIISYEDSQGIQGNQNLIGSAIVSREDEREVPRGVLIHQLVLKNR